MKDDSATSSESSQKLSTDSSATTAAPGRTGRKRGKMYWKFATLEGWRAKDRQNQNANQSTDAADDAERAEKTTGTPGD